MGLFVRKLFNTKIFTRNILHAKYLRFTVVFIFLLWLFGRSAVGAGRRWPSPWWPTSISATVPIPLPLSLSIPRSPPLSVSLPPSLVRWPRPGTGTTSIVAIPPTWGTGTGPWPPSPVVWRPWPPTAPVVWGSGTGPPPVAITGPGTIPLPIAWPVKKIIQDFLTPS